MISLPTGTVTFLFTDIQGSTQLWQKYPQLMPQSLARHHTLLRQAIEANEGYVFQIIGDAFCAAFRTARNGLDAALQAQRLFGEEPWGAIGAIRVRMALHTGSVELEIGEKTSGEYVSGITLSRSARLLSAGHGGQALLSQACSELLAYDLPEGVRLLDLGEHRLKDLVRPEHIYQLAASGLDENFPPLKTLDALPNNLPVQFTSFIGREEDLSRISSAILRDSPPTIRLITLLGPGGAGKTRLALQAAADLIEEFHDGAWFIDLSALSDPAYLDYELASAWGLREQPGRTIRQILVDYLHPKKLLLILDNCEHLVESVARLVDQLLRASRGLRIIATSREPLDIAGEILYRIPALSLPDLQHLPQPDELRQFEAIRLFLERANAVRPDFKVTQANAQALTQVCVRLDGIPLAIELAASRMRAFSVEQVNERLDDRFRLLTGGGRTAMPRQQTLQATVDWSYNLLTAAEQALFRRLSIFAGGWTLETAEAICADQTDEGAAPGSGILPGQSDLRIVALDIFDLLARLLDKSLVSVDEAEGEMRYHMLDTIHHYARLRLKEVNEEPYLMGNHFRYYLDLAHQFATGFEGPGQLVWLERMQMEHENMRAALRYSMAHDLEDAIELANALWMFWFSRGYFVEGRRWLEQIWEKASDTPISDLARSKASYVLGSFQYFQSDTEAAFMISQQGLALARASGDRRGELMSLHHLGGCESDRGNEELSQAHYLEGLKLAKEYNDSWAVSVLSTNLGVFMKSVGRDDEAESYFLDELKFAYIRQDGWTESYALGNLGELALKKLDYESAASYTQDAIYISRKFNDKNSLEFLLPQAAFLSARQGKTGEAVIRLMEAIQINNDLGRQRYQAEIFETVACYFVADDQAARAARLLGAADRLRQLADTQPTGGWISKLEVNQAMIITRLGEENFQAEYALGQEMSLDKAIREAAGGEIG